MGYYDYDEEVPAGCQDADLLQAQYEAESAAASARRKRGICDHGWLLGFGWANLTRAQIEEDRRRAGAFPQRPTDPAITCQDDIPAKMCLCLDCGQVVPDPLAGR